MKTGSDNDDADVPSWFMICGVLKSPEMINAELARIRRLVSRYCRDTRIDHEHLVVSIWLEQPDAGPNRVRSRVIDAIRASGRRVRAESVAGELHKQGKGLAMADVDTINRLAGVANLSKSEHEILRLLYWRGESVGVIAKLTNSTTKVVELRLKDILRRMWLAAQNDGL